MGLNGHPFVDSLLEEKTHALQFVMASSLQFLTTGETKKICKFLKVVTIFSVIHILVRSLRGSLYL